METGAEGNTVSFIDVDRAIENDANAVVASILVGTADPSEPTRPFGLAFTPDDRAVIVANFRSDTFWRDMAFPIEEAPRQASTVQVNCHFENKTPLLTANEDTLVTFNKIISS